MSIDDSDSAVTPNDLSRLGVVGGAEAELEGAEAVAQTGRALGPRALKTRQKLLDATVGLLRERSILDISVVDIARRAETSPATFYHYFKDVEEAALLLAAQAAEETPRLVELISGDWHGEQGLQTSRDLASRFIEHWETHHPVLTVRNLAADRGEVRFQEARRKALAPVLDALAEKIESEGASMPGTHPFAAAAALVSMLEKLAAHVRLLGDRGVRREELIQTTASILQLVVTGGRLA